MATREVTSLLSLLKNLVGVRNPPAVPVYSSVEDIVRGLEDSLSPTAPLLVTGAAGTGKSHLVQQLVGQLSGCVVHLHQAYDSIAGFDEAPLTGMWQGKGAAAQSVAELDDVLRSRPEGYFSLEMPPQSLTSVDMHDLLSCSLMSGVSHWEAARAARPLKTLTLIVEDTANWLVPALTTRILERGRAWKLRLVQVDMYPEHEPLWNNLGHVIAFKSFDAALLSRLSRILGESDDLLRSLPVGRCFYRDLSAAEAVPTKQVQVTWPAGPTKG